MIASCRSCGSPDLRIVLDLGSQPVANALLAEADLGKPEPKFPLGLAFCQKCSLLQVTETVPREVLYQHDYPYFSSASAPVLLHAAAHVDGLIQKYDLGSSSLVIEIASNDGYLLRNFVAKGIPCLGVDPAEGPAGRAIEESRVPTVCDFFGSRLAEEFVNDGTLADVVIANNVLAHVENINDFVYGISRILKPRGVAVFEFSYAVDMVRTCAFDLVYHEHLFYHTLHGLEPLFRRHGLYLNDAAGLPMQGGSLRLTVGRTPGRSSTLNYLFATERELGVGDGSLYKDLAYRVGRLRTKLSTLLLAKKIAGKSIACYGAAAKGNTLLNYLNLGMGCFDFVVDSTPFKQGKYTPGQHVPIVPPDRLLISQPDDVLVLAWNYAPEIIRNEATYRARGGTFIVPLPELLVLPPDQERSAA